MTAANSCRATELVRHMMLFVFIASLAVAVTTAQQMLVFSDDFDSLDTTKWEHELTMGGGGNWEFQEYTNNRSNSYVRDGVLYIKPTLQSDKYGEAFLTSGQRDIWGNTPPNVCTGNGWYGCLRVGTPDNIINPIVSARLRSSRSFSFTYGTVEVRARMPKGDWLWPAIWMLPRWNNYGDWPASGEIDLIETRGNLDLKDEGGQQVGHSHGGATLHWGPFFEANQYERSSGSIDDETLSSDFHVYKCEWTATGITLSVDDTVLYTGPTASSWWEEGELETQFPGIDNPWAAGSNMAPFDHEFYIIMNIAVGGTNGFFPDTWTNAGYPKPWVNTSPTAPRDFWNAKDSWYPTWAADSNNGEQAAMAIDYVRVYQDAN